MKRLLSAILILVAVMSSYGDDTSPTDRIEVQYFDIPDTLGIFSEARNRAPTQDDSTSSHPSSAGEFFVAKEAGDSAPELSEAGTPNTAIPDAATVGEPSGTPPSEPASPPNSGTSAVVPSSAPESKSEPISESPVQQERPNPAESPVTNCPEPQLGSGPNPQPGSEPDPQPDPTPVPEPTQPASIYDYPFDIEAIRSDLIECGERAGIIHVTTDDGQAITPNTASWGNPITAAQSFQGERLRRRLHDFVMSMPAIVVSYGGDAITQFTIYIEPQSDNTYTIYYLY